MYQTITLQILNLHNVTCQLHHNKADKRKRDEFYCKDLVLGFGNEEAWGEASKASSLLKRETVEDFPLPKHSLPGTRRAVGRDEGLHHIAWIKSASLITQVNC